MKRFWRIWAPFLLCLAVLLAAMGWITLAVVRLDRAEAEARQREAEARERAALEENIRLALWRMDSALAPLIAQESARPYFAYSTFVPVDRAYGRMFNRGQGGEMLIPSPLLGELAPEILVYFQFEPDGQLVSPQVPQGANYKLAVPKHIQEDTVKKAKRQLERVKALADRERLMAVLPKAKPLAVEVVASPMGQSQDSRVAARRRNDAQPQERGAVEFEQRNQALMQSANVLAQNRRVAPFSDPSSAATDVRGVPMTPLWIGGELLLARRITAGGREYVQGCLLNWRDIKSWLLETVEDLVPQADLEPVDRRVPEKEARMLAALPVCLVAKVTAAGGQTLPAVEREPSLSPIRLSLLVAWGCTGVAGVAVASLLRGVVALSERRAAFVSAVTHELRTPLTTFHMYTEMLAEGMVSDSRQQQTYFHTLRAEASRLTHLVENVLSYARLERGRTDGRIEERTVRELVEPVAVRLTDRAKQAGMELVVEGDDAAFAASVRANPSAVEQILFNLVDNACKYAAVASDRRIHLALQRSSSSVQLRIRDHGPGIARPASRRLFASFSKSAREAANSAPGVGLGLALSRRLAQAMGARLQLDRRVSDGACFVLTLAAKC